MSFEDDNLDWLNPQPKSTPQVQQAPRTRPPASGRLGGRDSHSESALPDFLIDNSASATEAAPSAAVQQGGGIGAQNEKTPHAYAADDSAVTDEKLESLRREVEAKKKQLQSARERESALQDKWRAQKAKKRAEIHQLDAQLRTVWGELEDEKSAGEGKIRETQDLFETQMRKARQDEEKRLREEYEPQIKQKQDQLDALKREEEQLKALLASEDESKDLINTAVSSAITTILGRLQKVFADNADDTQKWNESVQDLIRQEVRTSFAVTAGGEAEAERTEYKRCFQEMLDFWREAEEQERDRITQMDDTLMADLQRVAHEDLAILQKEERSMEEMYIASREAWAQQHQKLLQRELEETVQRRQLELEEHRRLRHQLHADRLVDLETRHREQMALEEEIHKKEMELLRSQFSKEEQLNEERQRAVLAAQREIDASGESLRGVITAMGGVLASLKEYEATIEERRGGLERQQREAAEQSEQMLKSIQDMAATLAGAAEDERRESSDTLTKVRLLGQTVEHHLEDEAAWLAQQEAKYAKDKDDWDREYHRWRLTVQREKQCAEQRFHEALHALQESTSLLAAEERDVQVEVAAMDRVFAEMSSAAEREKASLHVRQEEMQKRQAALAEAIAAYQQKSETVNEEWNELKKQRRALAQERDELQQDEGKLEQMMQALRLVKAQTEGLRSDSIAAVERGKALQYQLRAQQSGLESLGRDGSRKPDTVHPLAERKHGGSKRLHVSNNPNRLPNKVLRELEQHVAAVPKAFRHVDPNTLYGGADSSPAPAAAGGKERRALRAPRMTQSLSSASKPSSASLHSSRNSPNNDQNQRQPQQPQPSSFATVPAQQQQQQQQQPTRAGEEDVSSSLRGTPPDGIGRLPISSQPLSQYVSELSPSGRTFTNLVDFSEGDTLLD